MYKIDKIRLFTHTDFPEPVEPAIKRCGVLDKSSTWASPAMSFPKTTGIAIFLKAGISVSINSLKLTIARSLFGTSIPTACFPGMGATIRTLDAARRSAMLSPKATILLNFTPGAGRISNIVTTGPLRMPVTSASILNSFSVSLSACAERFVSSSITQYSPSG